MSTTLVQIAASLKPTDAIAERNSLMAVLKGYMPNVQREIWWADMFSTNPYALSAACDRLDPFLPCFETDKSARIRILTHALTWMSEIADAFIYRTTAQEVAATN